MKPVKIPDSSAENLITSYKERQEKLVRVSLVRENDEVQCPGPVINLLVSTRAKHISIIVITHVYYLEQRNHVNHSPVSAESLVIT